MAVPTIAGPEEAAPARVVVRPAPSHRRRWVAASFASAAVAVVVAGLVQAGPGSAGSRDWDASSRRLAAQAEAYVAQQEDIERGRAADSARLRAAADAFAGRAG